MNSKIKALKEMCSERNLYLVFKYYGDREVCFIGSDENDDDVFNVVLWYPPKENKRIFYIEINSQFEKWRGGQFTKEDLLLLMSIDDLSDEELGIGNNLDKMKEEEKQEKENE
jgi:hypothetical protein